MKHTPRRVIFEKIFPPTCRKLRVRSLDRLLLGIAGLSVFLTVFLFFSDDSHLSAQVISQNKTRDTKREMPVSLNNIAYKDHQELKSADVDLALDRYFEEIRLKPEIGEEDLRLVDELVPEEFGEEKAGAATTSRPAKPAFPHKKSDRVQVAKHAVKTGESIWRIAQRYGVSTQTIVAANKIKEKTVIQAGDTLRIPDRAGIFVKTKKKESLTEIAKRYKLPAETVRKANGLDQQIIAKGEELFLPGAKPLPEFDYIRRKVFSWPIKATHRLTSGFGWRVHPISGNKAFHSGIDIGAAMRTPIYAAADGVVVFAGDGGSYGNMIILRHKSGLFTVYGHASKLVSKKGSYVRRGQKIALVGSTGASTGAHLHFEVKSSAKYVNPHIALKKTERVSVKRRDA